MDITEKYERRVTEWLNENPRIFNEVLMLSDDDTQHVKNMCVSVLMHRDGMRPGGSFVEAVVDDSLSEAFARADHINQRMMKIYVMLLHNVGRVATPEDDTQES